MLTVVQPIQKDRTRTQCWAGAAHRAPANSSEGFHLLIHCSPGQGAVPHSTGRTLLAAFLSEALLCQGTGWMWTCPACPSCLPCSGCAYRDFVNLSYFTVQILPGMLVSPQGYQDVFILCASNPHFLTQECPQVGKKFQKGPRSWCYIAPSNKICPPFPGNLGLTCIKLEEVLETHYCSFNVLIALMSWTHTSQHSFRMSICKIIWGKTCSINRSHRK